MSASIKKHIGLILGIIGLLSPIENVSAKYHARLAYKHLHYVSVYGSIGYSLLLDDYYDMQNIGNVGGLIGVGYEFQYKGFWFTSGLEAQLLTSASLFNISGTDKKMLDSQGKSMLYHYEFNRSYDAQSLLYGNIPLLLGYYFRGFYIGAGAKVGYCFYSQEMTDLTYTTSGTYDQYIEDFAQMANHGYSTYYTNAHATIESGLKFSVIGEIGYDMFSWLREYNHTKHLGLKFSAYAEYGLNNILSGTSDVPLYSINSDNPTELILQPFYASRAGNAHRVIPLYVGFKVAWSFCLRTRNCDCNVGENHRNFDVRRRNMLN